MFRPIFFYIVVIFTTVWRRHRYHDGSLQIFQCLYTAIVINSTILTLTDLTFYRFYRYDCPSSSLSILHRNVSASLLYTATSESSSFRRQSIVVNNFNVIDSLNIASISSIYAACLLLLRLSHISGRFYAYVNTSYSDDTDSYSFGHSLNNFSFVVRHFFY